MQENIEMSNKKRIANTLFFIFIITGLIHFSSCKNIFDTTISEEKMAEILLDIHTAEILASIKDTNNKVVLVPTKDSAKLIDLYHSVLKHHNISYDEFIKNYYYYIEYRSADLDTIYMDIQQKILDLQNVTIHTEDGKENINLDPIDTDTIPSNSENRKLRPEQLNKHPQLEAEDD